MWEDLIIIGWFVLVVAMLCGFLAYTRKSGRRISESSTRTTSGLSYVGSLRWTRKRGFGGGGVSRGTCRLSVFDWGVCFSPSSPLLKPLVPTVDLRFGEIESARVGISRTAASECIEFRAPEPDFYLVFWTSQWPDVLDVLQMNGVNVNRTPIPIRTLSWPDR